MILNPILLVLCAAIAFFQYTEGFFSATISAICALFAGAMAMAFHEQVAAWLLASAPEMGNSIALVVIFAVTFVIPRFIIDGMVPGNVRFPFIADKIGAGVMGIICGLIATGILGVAADSLPYGTSFGMYSRLPLVTPDPAGYYLGKGGSGQDVLSHDVVQSDGFDPDKINKLWLREDDFVVGLIDKESDNGALAGDRAFASIHPDYLNELYGQRLGIQVGAMKTLSTKGAVTVDNVYTQPAFTQVDSEIPGIRGTQTLSATLTPLAGQTLLVVRTKFNVAKGAVDSDNIFRFSTGAINLICGHETDAGADYKDYHPVGILDPKRIAVANHIDDFLIMDQGEHTVDLLFIVDNDHAFTDSTGKSKVLAAGTFLQVKRLTYVDLSGKKVQMELPPNPDATPIARKADVVKAINAAKPLTVQSASGGAVAEAPTAPANGAANAYGLTYKTITESSKLIYPVNSDSPGETSGKAIHPELGVNGNFDNRKWLQLVVTPVKPAAELSTVDNKIEYLSPPDGQVLVQVQCDPPGINVWDWTSHIREFEVVDSDGHPYPIYGAMAKVQKQTQQLMAVTYDTGGNVPPLEVKASQGRPTAVCLIFAVKPGTNIKEVRYGSVVMKGGLNFTAMGQ